MTVEITHHDDPDYDNGEQIYVIRTHHDLTIEMSHNYAFGTARFEGFNPVAIRTPEYDDTVNWVSMNEETLEAINLIYMLLLREREDYNVEGN